MKIDCLTETDSSLTPLICCLPMRFSHRADLSWSLNCESIQMYSCYAIGPKIITRSSYTQCLPHYSSSQCCIPGLIRMLTKPHLFISLAKCSPGSLRLSHNFSTAGSESMKRICIVGSGPAGFYFAQNIFKVCTHSCSQYFDAGSAKNRVIFNDFFPSRNFLTSLLTCTKNCLYPLDW